MMEIKNDRDFRCGYELLIVLTEALTENGFGNPDAARKHIDDTKRALRAYARRDGSVDVGMGFKVDRRIVRDEGIDGYVKLVSIPEVFDTVEDADEFFKDFLEIHCRPSMYDCTGQAFTSWYKLFQRNGQFWAYHSVGFDV